MLGLHTKPGALEISLTENEFCVLIWSQSQGQWLSSATAALIVLLTVASWQPEVPATHPVLAPTQL